MTLSLLCWARLALPFVRAFARLRVDQHGQAMVEYSTLTFAFLIGSGALAFAVPVSELGNQTIVQALYAGFQTYVNSYFDSLSLVFP